MNKKQKMVYKMWRNYLHNCNMQKQEPLKKYKVFRNIYILDNFDELYKMKNWYRDIRI